MTNPVHSLEQEPYRGTLAIQVDSPARMAFLRKVYSLFGLALLIFAGTAWWASSTTAGQQLVAPIYRMGWIGMIAIMAVMFLVLRLCATRFPINVIALGGFAVVEGLITAPLILFVTQARPETASSIIAQAGVLTGVVFGGLTLYTLTSKRDFSFLGAGLWVGFAILIGAALLSMIFGLNLSQIGISIGWVILMAGFTVYDTSNIMRRYPTTMAAAAAAMLFLDVVIMFKQILLLLSSRD